jgi:excisionase family DNA binding protein
MTTTTSRELLTIAEVSTMLNLGKRTVCRWAAEGKMPQPVRLARRAVRWRRADLLDWIDRGCPDLKGGTDDDTTE